MRIVGLGFVICILVTALVLFSSDLRAEERRLADSSWDSTELHCNTSLPTNEVIERFRGSTIFADSKDTDWSLKRFYVKGRDRCWVDVLANDFAIIKLEELVGFRKYDADGPIVEDNWGSPINEFVTKSIEEGRKRCAGVDTEKTIENIDATAYARCVGDYLRAAIKKSSEVQFQARDGVEGYYLFITLLNGNVAGMKVISGPHIVRRFIYGSGELQD